MSGLTANSRFQEPQEKEEKPVKKLVAAALVLAMSVLAGAFVPRSYAQPVFYGPVIYEGDALDIALIVHDLTRQFERRMRVSYDVYASGMVLIWVQGIPPKFNEVDPGSFYNGTLRLFSDGKRVKSAEATDFLRRLAFAMAVIRDRTAHSPDVTAKRFGMTPAEIAKISAAYLDTVDKGVTPSPLPPVPLGVRVFVPSGPKLGSNG